MIYLYRDPAISEPVLHLSQPGKNLGIRGALQTQQGAQLGHPQKRVGRAFIGQRRGAAGPAPGGGILDALTQRRLRGR